MILVGPTAAPMPPTCMFWWLSSETSWPIALMMKNDDCSPFGFISVDYDCEFYSKLLKGLKLVLISTSFAAPVKPKLGCWITSGAVQVCWVWPNHWWTMFPCIIIFLNMLTNDWGKWDCGHGRIQPVCNKKLTEIMVQALLPDWHTGLGNRNHPLSYVPLLILKNNYWQGVLVACNRG